VGGGKCEWARRPQAVENSLAREIVDEVEKQGLETLFMSRKTHPMIRVI
jgi:hypothetical protein